MIAKGWKGHVAAIERAARNQDELAEAHSLPEYGEDGREMAKMYRKDARDLRQIAKYLAQGKPRKAHEKLWGMDTAARDQCPDAAWNAIQRALGN